jgi:hypothetical protein
MKTTVSATLCLCLAAVISLAAAPKTQGTQAYSNIRSVTWYEYTVDYATSLNHLQNAIPTLKAEGFNTVWLVTPWADLNPKPLASPSVYNQSNFNRLKQTVRALKNANMKAIIGLNYLGSGWSPEGIDYCTWTENPVMYGSFEAYVNQVMSQLSGLEDSVYLLVFTENSEPCTLDPYNDAQQVMAVLRSSIGSMPTRLNQANRVKFKIGYHDYSYINLGWGDGDSPVASPNSFDFMSMVAYGLDPMTDSQISTELATRASRFRTLYPTLPLIIGEYGGDYCWPYGEENQSRVDTDIASFGLTNNYGSSVWEWVPISVECNGYSGLSLNRPDGSSRPSATALKSLLQPTPLN